MNVCKVVCIVIKQISIVKDPFLVALPHRVARPT